MEISVRSVILTTSPLNVGTVCTTHPRLVETIRVHVFEITPLLRTEQEAAGIDASLKLLRTRYIYCTGTLLQFTEVLCGL